MSLMLKTPQEIAREIAIRARAKRLSLNLTQKTLSERSGVSVSVLKKFEHTGKISLESLLKLALSLDALEDFLEVFKSQDLEKAPSLEAILKEKNRKRGRE